MSATGRSNVRRADDYYSTPEWCTVAICEELLPEIEELNMGQGFALDPCAGDGGQEA